MLLNHLQMGCLSSQQCTIGGFQTLKKNGLERRTIRPFRAETLFTSDARMISCVMQVVFVKTERCANGAADHHRGFCRRSTEGNSRSHQSLDLLLAAPRFLLSLFYSNNSAVAERHIMTKLVMMGSRRDYNPTRLISTTQSGAHVLSVLISLSLSLLQF